MIAMPNSTNRTAATNEADDELVNNLIGILVIVAKERAKEREREFVMLKNNRSASFSHPCAVKEEKRGDDSLLQIRYYY